MKFKEALKLAKEGNKIKLPSWRGYWAWENDTIMMHCFKEDSDTGEELLDIRQTERVEYTLLNVASEEWEIAHSANCELLGGIHSMSFGDAIKYLKRGLKVKRKGWNGKEQYIQLASNISYKNAAGETVNADHEAIGNNAIAFVGTSGVQLGWLASQADMLAQDWTFAD